MLLLHTPQRQLLASPAQCFCRHGSSSTRSVAAHRKRFERRKTAARAHDKAMLASTPPFQPFESPEERALRLPKLRGNEPLPYPYGPRRWFKQSNRGLYGTLSVRTGNNVSSKNEIKTRTRWKPNIQYKGVWSRALGRAVKVRVATRVLRTIDKVGGLDEYLLGGKPARLKELGPAGWALRWKIMRTPAVQRRFEEERVRLGLPREGIGLVGLWEREKVDVQLMEREADRVLEEEGTLDADEEWEDIEGREATEQGEAPEQGEAQGESSTAARARYRTDRNASRAEEPVTVQRRPWSWKFWKR